MAQALGYSRGRIRFQSVVEEPLVAFVRQHTYIPPDGELADLKELRLRNHCTRGIGGRVQDQELGAVRHVPAHELDGNLKSLFG